MNETELKTIVLCLHRMQEEITTIIAMLPTCDFCKHYKQNYEYPLSNGETENIQWCNLHKHEVGNGGCEEKEVVYGSV